MLARVLKRLRTERSPVRAVLSRVLWRSGMCRLFIIRCGEFRLRFFPTSLSAQYWLYPEERTGDADLLRSVLRPGDRYVDVGANIGALAIGAAVRVGPAGSVVAIEPHPRIFEYLRQNVALNGLSNVETVNCAVGATEGVITFSNKTCDDQNLVDAGGALTVPVRTLDSILASFPGDIRLLKIDTEGFELFVLQGGSQTLQRSEFVYFEVSSEQYARFGYSVGDVIALLSKLGLSVYRTGSGSGSRVGPDYVPPRRENLLAIREPGTAPVVGGDPPRRPTKTAA